MSLLVGTRKGLFTLERSPGSTEWVIDRVDFLGEPVTAVLQGRDGSMYAALNLGHFGCKLWRREPGGEWQEVGVPVYPARPADATDVSPMTQVPWRWSLEVMWVLENGPAERPDELWCGTIPGGLFRSPDRGESWEMVRSLWDMPERQVWMGGGYDWPGIHSISLDPRSPSTVLVGVSCGGTWRSDDDGATWTVGTGMTADFLPPDFPNPDAAQDPHRVSRCAAHPDVVWNQHHFGVYRSVDGGSSWTAITERPPSLFGFAVVAHPTDPDTAWFVPAIRDQLRIPVDGKLVVSRTTDGGRSFEVLGEGLPQEHAYDLVYRHALDVDTTGTQLVIGSTTGSVFTSADSGEHWQPVSTHLPPVYVTRFTA